MDNVYKLSTAIGIRSLRGKLYLMQMLIGEWELALQFSTKRQTLRDFINGSRQLPPPRITQERLEHIVKQHIKYHLPTDPAFRIAQLQLLSLIYPKLLATQPDGNLTPSRTQSKTTVLVRDYLVDQRNKGATVTKKQVAQYFQSPAWVKQYGYPINEQTIRSAINRVLGQWPELTATCVNAAPGRRPGSKLKTYGTSTTE